MSYFLPDWPFFDYQTMSGGRYRLLNVCLTLSIIGCVFVTILLVGNGRYIDNKASDGARHMSAEKWHITITTKERVQENAAGENEEHSNKGQLGAVTRC